MISNYFITLSDGDLAAKYRVKLGAHLKDILSSYVEEMPNGKYIDENGRIHYASLIGLLENDKVVLLNRNAPCEIYELRFQNVSGIVENTVICNTSRSFGTFTPLKNLCNYTGKTTDILSSVLAFNSHLPESAIVGVYEFPEEKASSDNDKEIEYFDNDAFISKLKSQALRLLKCYASAMPNGEYLDLRKNIRKKPKYLGYFLPEKSSLFGSIRAINEIFNPAIGYRETELQSLSLVSTNGGEVIGISEPIILSSSKFTLGSAYCPKIKDFINSYNLHCGGIRDPLVAVYPINALDNKGE